MQEIINPVMPAIFYLLSKATKSFCSAFAIYKRHLYFEYAKEAVRGIFFPFGATMSCPTHALFDRVLQHEARAILQCSYGDIRLTCNFFCKGSLISDSRAVYREEDNIPWC